MRFPKLTLIFSCLLVLPIVGNLQAQASDPDYALSGVAGSMQPDLFTGTAATGIPIEVPPGRHGIQPALSLQYWSGNGDGWLGLGWKLEVGAIQRQTRMGLNYTGDDYTFRLGGVSTDVVSIGNGEYRAKIEGGFSRVKKLTAADGKPYWEATDKKGTRYLFGQTAASRQADPADASKIFKWCLDQVIDTNGNYMTATYTGYQGQGYLTQIDYTGNGATAPTNTVKFYLETRPDALPMYTTNFLVVTDKRLKTIDVRANGNRVRAYKLNYTTSTSSSRSLLSSVQQYGKDATLDGSWTVTGGSALPAIVIGSQTGTNGFSVSPTFSTPDAFSWTAPDFWTYGDFNGDGKLDIIYHLASPTYTKKILFSNGDGTFTAGPAFSTPDASSWTAPDFWTYGDFNGDGKLDIIYHLASPANTKKILFSNGDGTFTTGPTTTFANVFSWSVAQGFWAYGDFNGDGKTDIIYHLASPTYTKKVLFSNGDGTFTAASSTVYTPDAYSWTAPDFWTYGDFNGDGKLDIIYHLASPTYTKKILFSNGDGTFTAASSTVYTPDAFSWSVAQGFWAYGDFNGDGKLDIIYHLASPTYTKKILFSNGNGTFTAASSTVYTPDAYSWTAPDFWTYGDFNGDGKLDIIYHLASPANTKKILFSNGDGTFTTGPTTTFVNVFSWSVAQGFWDYGDFDGDGRTDIIYHLASPYYTKNVLRMTGPLDLVESLSNGLGGTTTIAYKPSTQYTNTQLPFPIQTVSSITTNDGNGNVSTTNYTYSGGFYHIGERDLRGFNYAKVTGPVGPSGEQAISETWFHQGNDLAVDANTPNVGNGYMKGKPYRSRVTDGAGHIYSETTTIYAADANGVAPFFNPPQQVDAFICDGNTCGKQTRSIMTYDAYGNVTREDQYGDFNDGSDDRTVIRTFSPNTIAWIVGLPTSETIYPGIGTSGQAAQTSFYYDGTTSCATASTNQTPTVGNLTRVVRWLNGGTSPETRMAYDAYGNLTCTRDANGNTTTMTYDASFTFPKVVTNALNPPQQKTTQYYGVDGVAADTGLYGQVKSVTDPNNAVISTTYDVFGRASQVNFPDGGWTSTSYNSFGTVGSQNIQTSTQVSLSTWKYFDGLGRTTLVKKTGPDSKTIATQTQYNVRGAVSQTSLPYFYGIDSPTWNTVTYDPVGRVLQTTHPDSSRTLACYDDWVTVGIDANNHRKRETRDAYGRLVKVEEYTGTFSTCDTTAGSPYATTSYQYDVLGNLRFVTDHKGNVSEMQYDTLSRKTFMHDPDMGNWTYQYDAAGNLTRQTDAKSQNIYFRYDALNRRQQKDYGTQKALGSGDVIYNYDGATGNGKGRLTSVQDQSGSAIFYYDTLGRTTRSDKSLDGTTYVIQTSYDTLGRALTLTYPGNAVVSYAYNGPLLLKTYEGATTYGQYAGYNALGQPGTMTFGNGVVTTYTYSNSGNTTCTQQNFRPCTIKTVLGLNPAYQDLLYTYDSGGKITQITDVVNGNQTFGYDEINRLTSATGPYGSQAYSYNEIGNLLSNPLAGSYTYPTSGVSSVRPHAVSTAGSNTYGYDNNGNMTSGAGRTLGYDTENRPTSVTSGGVTTTMVYDGDGGRVKKIAGTLTVRYIGKLYECDNATCVKYIFAGDRRIAVKQVTNGLVDYYHQDHLGSSSVITNGTTGALEERVSYHPYGATHTNTSFTSPPTDVPFKYTGQELDSSTGLYFYGARYYDATLGRFISADFLVPAPQEPQDMNRYSYGRNNPMLYNDPTGHFAWAVIAIAAIAGAVSAGIQSHWDPGKVFLGAAISGASAAAGVGAFGALESAGLNIVVRGAIAGAVGGLTSASLYSAAGYQADFGRSIAAGAVGGGLASYIGSLQGLESFEKILGYGFSGGIASEVAGGRFEEGLALAATASLAFEVYKNYVGFPIDLEPGAEAKVKTKNVDAYPKTNNFGPAVEVGTNPSGFCYEGSACSNFFNEKCPGCNATAGWHDTLTGRLERYWRIPFALSNIPTMPPSLALTLTGALQVQQPLPTLQILERTIRERERGRERAK